MATTRPASSSSGVPGGGTELLKFTRSRASGKIFSPTCFTQPVVRHLAKPAGSIACRVVLALAAASAAHAIDFGTTLPSTLMNPSRETGSWPIILAGTARPPVCSVGFVGFAPAATTTTIIDAPLTGTAVDSPGLPFAAGGKFTCQRGEIATG